ncbi:DUF2141 domain-containing protein [Flavobacterium ginsenosidimutans]|uniref:DUF2141 domain-containing protein n=1 Tax=Flavobacterium ginsenosidimutans TaxID=687844 RepID=A0ABZ2Q267_9FLAO
MNKTIAFGVNLMIGLLFLLGTSSVMAQQETKVKVTGMKSAKGKIILNVFKDDAQYNDEKPFKTFSFDKKAISNGELTISVDLPQGTYGITLVDDENGNGKIDKNLIGMPKEGFGFSNFYMEKLKKPAFNDFKVDLKSTSDINIKVKYM